MVRFRRESIFVVGFWWLWDILSTSLTYIVCTKSLTYIVWITGLTGLGSQGAGSFEADDTRRIARLASRLCEVQSLGLHPMVL
jgi:hypothetical protein